MYIKHDVNYEEITVNNPIDSKGEEVIGMQAVKFYNKDKCTYLYNVYFRGQDETALKNLGQEIKVNNVLTHCLVTGDFNPYHINCGCSYTNRRRSELWYLADLDLILLNDGTPLELKNLTVLYPT